MGPKSSVYDNAKSAFADSSFPRRERNDAEYFSIRQAGYNCIHCLQALRCRTYRVPYRQPDAFWRVEIAVGLNETIRVDAIGCVLLLEEVYARLQFADDRTGSASGGQPAPVWGQNESIA